MNCYLLAQLTRQPEIDELREREELGPEMGVADKIKRQCRTPALNADGREVLQELGLAEDDIERLPGATVTCEGGRNGHGAR